MSSQLFLRNVVMARISSGALLLVENCQPDISIAKTLSLYECTPGVYIKQSCEGGDLGSTLDDLPTVFRGDQGNWPGSEGETDRTHRTLGGDISENFENSPSPRQEILVLLAVSPHPVIGCSGTIEVLGVVLSYSFAALNGLSVL